MPRQSRQDRRIEAVLSRYGAEDFQSELTAFYRHLQENLQLPVEVKGIEDFRWEEFYLLGPGDSSEYRRLKKTQPSYEEVYDLLRITWDEDSQWALSERDLVGIVKRKSDGREFALGLSELKATQRKSEEYQLLHDYSVWFANAF